MQLPLGKEPLAIIGAILAALNGIQTQVINMPTWAHTTIVVASTILGIVLARSQVTPASNSGV